MTRGDWFLVTVIAILLLMGSYARGYASGVRDGRDIVFCAMDRLTNSQPIGARGPSVYCKRIDAARDAR